MLGPFLQAVVSGRDLDEHEARAAMDAIMAGEATPAQIAGFLVGLRMKGETAAEVAGFARAMRERVTPVRAGGGPVVDTCGTGGDGLATFNISTAAAFVAAGAGLRVAKHGNRSVSSRSGSADVLEALGIPPDQPAEAVGQALEAVGIGFCFAPRLHGAMKHAAGPRRELGIRTVFNILGPLTNPAGARRQVIGVYAPELTRLLGEVLVRLGAERAFVVHGAAGEDELSLAGPSTVTEVVDGRTRSYTVHPEDVGLRPAPVEVLKVGSPAESAAVIERVLAGAAGPHRDVVCLNAGCALVAGGLAQDLADGVRLAGEVIDSGRARRVLDGLRAFAAAAPAERTPAGGGAAGSAP